MGDGRGSPPVQPPPRISATDPGAADGRNRSADGAPRGRKITRLALSAAMVLGLLAVFVVLPRWQVRSQTATSEQAATEKAVPQPVAPMTGLAAPTASASDSNALLQRRPSPTPLSTAPSRPSVPDNRSPAADDGYVAAVSEGLSAVDHHQWAVARTAFERAARLRPGTPEVADGLRRVEAGERLRNIAGGLRRARELEREEAWQEAADMYSSVLAIDPQSAEGLAGKRRTAVRVALDERLEFHIANPSRLTTPAVQEDAAEVLDAARGTTPGGPRLASQITRLASLLELATTPVMVVLESDEMTAVTVYRVGRLGTFARRELRLAPGMYTVVGTRDGFRDVRLQLVVDPATPPSPLLVRCTERL